MYNRAVETERNTNFFSRKCLPFCESGVLDQDLISSIESSVKLNKDLGLPLQLIWFTSGFKCLKCGINPCLPIRVGFKHHDTPKFLCFSVLFPDFLATIYSVHFCGRELADSDVQLCVWDSSCFESTHQLLEHLVSFSQQISLPVADLLFCPSMPPCLSVPGMEGALGLCSLKMGSSLSELQSIWTSLSYRSLIALKNNTV